MAISLKATGSWLASVSSHTITLVGTPAAGDRYYIWEFFKPFNASPQAMTGWTEVTQFADGSVASAASVGSVKVICRYRDWQSGDTSPVSAITSQNVAAYVMQLWTKGAGDTWDTPTFVTAAWPATSTTQTVNASSTTTVPNSSVVMCGLGLRNDSATFTRTTTSIAATSGVTWNGNYVESPATHIASTSGDDISADLGHRFVTTGGAGITLQTDATISAVETGAALWVIQSASPPITPSPRNFFQMW